MLAVCLEKLLTIFANVIDAVLQLLKLYVLYGRNKHLVAIVFGTGLLLLVLGFVSSFPLHTWFLNDFAIYQWVVALAFEHDRDVADSCTILFDKFTYVPIHALLW